MRSLGLRFCAILSLDCMVILFFFFFQAEDGIRDYKVTGVQTVLFRSGRSNRALARYVRLAPAGHRHRAQSWPVRIAPASLALRGRYRRWMLRLVPGCRVLRSEERRVGKGWRFRWGPDR